MKKQKKIKKIRSLKTKKDIKNDLIEYKTTAQTKEMRILKDESTRSLFAAELLGNLKIFPHE